MPISQARTLNSTALHVRGAAAQPQRDYLAQRAAREGDENVPPDHYVARIGRLGQNGAHLVLEDVRHAETDEPVTDHVWCQRTEDFAHAAEGDRVRFSAPAQPYLKSGNRGMTGRRKRVVDYAFGKPIYVELLALVAAATPTGT